MCVLGLLLCSLAWVGCNSNSSSESAGGAAAKPMSAVQAALDGKAISDAMQKATSWHMNMKSAQADVDMDVVCPDKMHTVSKTGNMSAEMVRIGDQMYTKAGAKWMKMPGGMKQAPVCGGASATNSGGATAKAPTLDPTVKFTKGGTETVNGETCTDYTWTAGGKSSTMCVGSDNLPRLMKSGDATITYSNWNKPITIEAPKS
jgi:hypothetical protein